jgi:hypothetical protein
MQARVSLTFPPDTYRDVSVFDAVGDQYFTWRNLEVVALPPRTQMLSFGFRLVNPWPEERTFSVKATEIKVGRSNIKVTCEAIDHGEAQFGTTPLNDVRLVIGDVVFPDRERPPTGVLPRPIDGERIAPGRVKMASGSEISPKSRMSKYDVRSKTTRMEFGIDERSFRA